MKFERSLLISGFGYKAFQNLALMIDGPPKAIPLTVPFYEHFV